jgi:hypothetical protein
MAVAERGGDQLLGAPEAALAAIADADEFSLGEDLSATAANNNEPDLRLQF